MNSRRSDVLLILAAATWLGGSVAARGDIVLAESIEWIVADSAVIVQGRVMETRGTAKGGTSIATVAVSEVLKGPKTLERVRVVDASGQLDALRGADTEVVLFLSAPPNNARQGTYHLRQPCSSPSLLRLDGKGEGKFFDMEFQVLTRPDDVLAAAKHALVAGDPGQKPARHQMELPGSTPAFEELWAGSSVRFYVPANSHLEKLARGWVAPKNGERTPLEADLELEGARALKYFKSEDNAALLKELLKSDRHFVQQVIHVRAGRRVYYLRRVAYEMLRSWEIDVPEPVFEEPFP